MMTITRLVRQSRAHTKANAFNLLVQHYSVNATEALKQRADHPSPSKSRRPTQPPRSLQQTTGPTRSHRILHSKQLTEHHKSTLLHKLLVRATSQRSFEPDLEFLQQASTVLQQVDTVPKMHVALPLCKIVERATAMHGVAATECVRIYAALGRYRNAVDLAFNVLHHNFFFSNTALISAIDATCALGEVEKGFELFDLSVARGTNPSRNVYGSLLALTATIGESPSSPRIQKLLDNMGTVGSGCEMDCAILHHWMVAYARTGHYSQVIELFETMHERFGLVPNESTYVIRMDASAEQGDYTMTMSLLDQLKQQPELQVQLPHYNVALKACGKASALTHAFHLYEEMKEHKIQPDVVTYITMMHAVYHGELGEINPTKVKLALSGVGAMGFAFVPFINYQEHLMTVLFCSSLVGSMGLAMYMNPNGVRRTLYPDSYTEQEENESVIQAFFRRLREEDHCGRSMYLWREMLKHGVPADAHVYDVLARTCIKKRHPELAFEAVFEQQLPLIDGRTGSFMLPQATVVSFLHALLSQRRLGMADTVFDAARTHRVFDNLFHEKGDVYTYTLLPFTTLHVRSYVVRRVLQQWHAERKLLGRSVPRMDFLVLHGFDLLDQLDRDDPQIRALFAMDEMVKVNGRHGNNHHNSSGTSSQPPFYYRLSVPKDRLLKFLDTTLVSNEKL